MRLRVAARLGAMSQEIETAAFELARDLEAEEVSELITISARLERISGDLKSGLRAN